MSMVDTSTGVGLGSLVVLASFSTNCVFFERAVLFLHSLICELLTHSIRIMDTEHHNTVTSALDCNMSVFSFDLAEWIFSRKLHQFRVGLSMKN